VIALIIYHVLCWTYSLSRSGGDSAKIFSRSDNGAPKPLPSSGSVYSGDLTESHHLIAC